MAPRKKPKKRGGALTYFVVLVATCLLAYVGFRVYESIGTQTAVIEMGDLGNQYKARAVIVRNETLTDAEGLTRVKYHAGEGETVYKGQKIADVYATGYSQTDINKLLNTRNNIKTHVQTLLATELADAQLARHDSEALEYAKEVGMLAKGKAQGNLVNLERQLAISLERRQTYLRGKYGDKDQSLIEYYEAEATQMKKIESWTSTYLASSDCIVSFYTDGWENVLDLETFDDIPLSQVQSILAGENPPLTTVQRGRSAVFREVSPGGWYLLLVSSDPNWNPVEGQTYKVRLEGFDDYVVDGTVTTFTRSGNEALVRMQVSADVRPVLNLRTASAEVGEVYVSGLKVPLNAIYYHENQTGVVLTDGGGLFVPATVEMQDNAYAIIKPLVEGYLSAGKKIQLF